MRRIDKQDVPWSKLPEDSELNILDVLIEYLQPRTVAIRDDIQQQSLGIRLNECKLDRLPKEQFIDVEHGAGRVAGAHFDDSLRAQISHHGIQNDGIRVGVVRVLVPVSVAGGFDVRERQLLVPGQEVIQKFELARLLQIDSGNLLLNMENRIAIHFNLRNRRDR